MIRTVKAVLAPKGRNMTAQGNALGMLKGRKRLGHRYFAPSGLMQTSGSVPQGVALGFHVAPRWGSRPRRGLATILEEPASTEIECALLSAAALAKDWNRPEEDEAWSHLQPDR